LLQRQEAAWFRVIRQEAGDFLHATEGQNYQGGGKKQGVGRGEEALHGDQTWYTATVKIVEHMHERKEQEKKEQNE
jgi:hypothetical protein